jgi:hypothetical protein
MKKTDIEVVDLAGYNLGMQSTCSSVNKNISKVLFVTKFGTKTIDKYESCSKVPSPEKPATNRHLLPKKSKYFKYVISLIIFRHSNKTNKISHSIKSATLSQNRLTELQDNGNINVHNISPIKFRKCYIEGEENVKDYDESNTNASRIRKNKLKGGNYRLDYLIGPMKTFDN